MCGLFFRSLNTSRRWTGCRFQTGREEFLEWLMEPTEYAPARSEFLLKLSFSNNISKDKTIQLATEYKTLHTARLEKYR